MVIYQTISALVNQIPADTWEVLREIKSILPPEEVSDIFRRVAERSAREAQQARSGRSSTFKLAAVDL